MISPVASVCLERYHHAWASRGHLRIFPRSENTCFEAFSETGANCVEAVRIETDLAWIHFAFVLVRSDIEFGAVCSQTGIEVSSDARGESRPVVVEPSKQVCGGSGSDSRRSIRTRR